MKLVENIMHIFITNGMIKSEDYEVYYYCFDIVLSKIFYICIIISIAFLLGQVSITAAYYTGFSAIRYTSGGYHANSPKTCFLLSIAVYLGGLGLIHIVPVTANPEILSGTLLLAVLLVFLFAPVAHPNKPFSPREKDAYQKKSRIAIIGCVVLTAILWPYNPLLSWAVTVGCSTAAGSVVAAKKCIGVDQLC